MRVSPCLLMLITAVLGAGAAAQSLDSQVVRSVPLWSDLARLDGRAGSQAVLVREARRSGHAVFVATVRLPAWAAPADIPGLAIGDRSGTGKWIHRFTGPVDFGRLGTVQDGSPQDERDALAVLVNAGFDEISIPEGRYDAYLDFPVSGKLTISGAGPDKTVFVGDATPGRAAFKVDGSLHLEGVRFTDQLRLAWANFAARQQLGLVKISLHDVAFDVVAPVSGANNAVIQTGGTEPAPGTTFCLEMRDCTFDVASDMEHVNARAGLTGFVERCTFVGGRRGINNIPSSSAHSAGSVSNDFSPDFRVRDCTFDRFSYAGAADSYHMQVTGKRWIVSGCTFGAVAGSGATSAGNVYSVLADSHFIGCTFAGGGFCNMFFKGAARTSPATTVRRGNGWGNSVIGCTFDGSAGVLQQGQVYMNVREQRFFGCRFVNYATYAIVANQQGDSSDNLLIDGCSFSSPHSPSAIRLVNGGRNIRILNSTFSDITGTTGARFGVLVFDPFPGQTTRVFEDVVVERCVFQDCASHCVYFYPAQDPYTVRRFRFVANSVSSSPGRPLGRGFLAGGTATVQDMVLEDNHISVGMTGWNMPPCAIARSRDNTWIDNGGTFPPSEEARGAASATVVKRLTLSNGATLTPSRHQASLVVAGAGQAVTIALASGAFDGQGLVLIGDSDTGTVTIPDAGNAALAAARTLGASDTLRLLWSAAMGTWCEVGFSDN